MAESKVEFTIRGLDSDRDRRDVADTLADLNGVMETNLEGERASVRYDEDVLGGEQVEKRVREMGYETA